MRGKAPIIMVILGKQKTDWIGGITNEIIPLNDGNWDKYRPVHEIQNNPETWGCSLFSGLDCVETLFMYYLHKQLIPPKYVKWLTKNKYFIDGFINFSEAYNYQFADVQKRKGTHLYKANDAIRKGLIPEAIYTFKDYFINNKPFPYGTEFLIKEFNKRFTINWYWVENVDLGIKASPLQATVRFTNGNQILKPEGKHNHAVMAYNTNDCYYIDDSYNQRDKRYHKAYVANFIGYTLTINTSDMNIKKFLQENDKKWVRNSNTGAFGRVLQDKLRTIKTNDRGVLILLDDKVRINGVNITNEEWTTLPKQDF